MHEPKDIAQQFFVIWILFEFDQLDVEDRETLVGFGEKFAQQVIHDRNPIIECMPKPDLDAWFGVINQPRYRSTDIDKKRLITPYSA